MDSSNSSGLEYSQSSSVGGLPVVQTDSSLGRSRSSSSSGSRKPKVTSKVKGSSAHSARPGKVRANWKDMMKSHKPPLMVGSGMDESGSLESGNLASGNLEPLDGAMMPGVHHRSGGAESSFGNHQTTNQQFIYEDQRQIHLTAASVDPGVVASAAQAVLEARAHSFEAQGQAAQAVMDARAQSYELQGQAVQAVAEARSQAMEFGLASHSQITALRNELVDKDAALTIANERVRLMESQLGERMREIEMMRASLMNDPNGTGNLTAMFEHRIQGHNYPSIVIMHFCG